ncbi:MAG: uncharacterized protein QOG43_3014 [Actinomycetota bacterium]|jgi:uncharacterized protein YceH (UPF0502 family)|nr:uncharacterized protein [Actinomycetota bacterium]
MALTPVQVRILGCLMEKERTTPDNYPLTLNALMAACNQTTNRHPVSKLEEATVSNALLNLRGLNLVRIVYSRSNRADRFRQVLDETLGLDGGEAAVSCLLMLRGPQTASELRARSERLHPFVDQDDVDDTLARLARRDEPLVAKLERQPGQKENRWAQLLGGELPGAEAPSLVAVAAAVAGAGDGLEGAVAAPASSIGVPTSQRLAALEAALQALQDEVVRLRAEHDDLVRQLQ